jgi:RNA polymerase sigma-70 factor (ECF subfamily)
VPGHESEESFRTLFESHRRAITLHCYRMLGSLHDAEEIGQDTLVRAWQRRDESRSTGTMRAWLYKIATNACLDHLRKARRRRALPHLIAPPWTPTQKLGPPTDEQLWVEPAPDSLLLVEDEVSQRPDHRVSQRESIGLAFITALQFLSPKQRAALLLVDVLGYSAEEAAALLETSVASVNSLLQRARKGVDARRGDSVPQKLSGADADLLRRFITAWESGDVEEFAALLADDALFSMPPQAEWFTGRQAIRGFFGAIWASDPARRRLVPIEANGGPAVALYRQSSAQSGEYLGTGVTLLAIDGGRVSRITRFGVPSLLALFGLPSQLPDGGGGT